MVGDRLSAGKERQRVVPETAELLLHGEEQPRIRDGRFDFQPVFHDAVEVHQPFDIVIGHPRHLPGVEIAKGLAVALPLPENRYPAQPGLGALQHEEFEQLPVVGHRSSPLLVVVFHIQPVGSAPTAASVYHILHRRPVWNTPPKVAKSRMDAKSGRPGRQNLPTCEKCRHGAGGGGTSGTRIAGSRGMGKRISDWIGQYRCMDWAVLYLRLFTGASMLFHNIGKIQNYNEIISSYPSPLYINPPAVFVIVTVAEALLAVLIIMGLWVRMSALVMSLGILLMFAWGGFGAGEPEFAWLGIYVFLIVSGGGLYAFDAALTPSDRKK